MDIGELGGTRRPTALNRPKWQIPIEWFGPRGAGPCLSGGLFIHIRDKIINIIKEFFYKCFTVDLSFL
jgi:hypothetical protein